MWPTELEGKRDCISLKSFVMFHHRNVPGSPLKNIFALWKDRVCYDVWLCYASGGFCYTVHRAKNLSIWITSIKISDNKDRKKNSMSERIQHVYVSSAQTIANSQRAISLKRETLERLVVFSMQNLCREHLCPQLSNLVNRHPKISLPLSLPLSQHICWSIFIGNLVTGVETPILGIPFHSHPSLIHSQFPGKTFVFGWVWEGVNSWRRQKVRESN